MSYKLYYLNKLGNNIQLQKLHKPAVDRERILKIILLHHLINGYRFSWKGTYHPCYPARSTQNHRFQSQGIYSAQYFKTISESVNHTGDVHNIPSRLFDSLIRSQEHT